MKFEYIGLKTDGERAFKEKTGIEWMPGDVHDVTDADTCAEMLKHPTIWQPVNAGTVKLANAKKTLVSTGPVSDDDVTDEAEAAERAKKAAEVAAAAADGDPLAGMDDAAVRAFAKAKGLKIPGIGLLKPDNLRAKVLAALPK